MAGSHMAARQCRGARTHTRAHAYAYILGGVSKVCEGLSFLPFTHIHCCGTHPMLLTPPLLRPVAVALPAARSKRGGAGGLEGVPRGVEGCEAWISAACSSMDALICSTSLQAAPCTACAHFALEHQDALVCRHQSAGSTTCTHVRGCVMYHLSGEALLLASPA